ncbi:hypothetical protein EPUS_03909 [Endocarpon pusillum Z07020]|uniref:Major facilitator superfamily (MFS) profile domain-containing protein n=1 Tax=Endocarpon pusillum (strain Z07020 / HMAS-L-300199) TaxID=1263415 RepID=U1GR60_ENDPU|nr:uncharacterized protein EPUS_03909 [Endocarpon pusillum Z07020]ERF74471.1 hypothetical protein EPUS_03909 [Endocarpon pusillum Z07020]
MWMGLGLKKHSVPAVVPDMIELTNVANSTPSMHPVRVSKKSEEGSIAHVDAPLSSVHAIPDSDNDKALPKTQIFFLCYARLFESIAFYLIFPFINQMILEVGDVEEANVGFYSGLIESLFSLTQMVLMIPWGRAADRFGRKPVLVFSLVGSAIATALFGIITPVFWFTRPELGGYGFSPLWISIFLGATGFLQAVWVLFIFPPLQYRIGTGGVMRLCSYGFPLLYAFSPVTNLLLRMDLRLAFWLSTPALQLLSSAVGMSFIVIQLALNDIAPSSIALGTLNAIALTITSGIRTVAPAIFTSIFAVGVQNQILWGYLVWVVMVLLALTTAAAVRWLPKEAEGKSKESG